MIQLVGDIALTGLYVDNPDKNFERIQKIIPFFNDEYLKFANLETPIDVENNQNPLKNLVHTSSKKAYELLKFLDINGVSLANNHIYDCGIEGVKKTIASLEKLEIKFTGAGYLPQHLDPIITIKNHQKIAFMAFVCPSTNPKTEFAKDLYLNYYSVENVLQNINKIKEKTDIIICSIHWGTDYSHYPTSTQITEAQQLIDAGATVIMGHHTHTIQPFQKYKNGIIFYGLGSLTFGDYLKKNNKYGALFRKTKTGLIVSLDQNLNPSFQLTLEKIGNLILPISKNYQKWNMIHWKIFHLSNKYKIFIKIRNFKEKTIDRIIEYFFGYYQNPIQRLFQFKNLMKIKKIF